MALAGEGVVAIWNDITAEGRAEFYDWHLREHIPERVGIPGFRRGRRYIATDSATAPEFFTLYEADGPRVLVGRDYAERLNAPTPWTKRATQAFRNTSRALARVAASFGPGVGGIVLTLRFDASPGRGDALRKTLATDVLPALAQQRQITGAHLCLADREASAVRSAESEGRTDLLAAPSWIVLVEGCTEAAVAAACAEPLSDAALIAAGAAPPIARGSYRLEHLRAKTELAAT